MDRLPEGILEAAFRRLESGGNDLLKMHPDYGEQEDAELKAHAAVKDKLTRSELSAIQDAAAWDVGIHFKVGYAAGLGDGIATRAALAYTEAAAAGEIGLTEQKSEAVLDRFIRRCESMTGDDEVTFLAAACHTIRALADEAVLPLGDADDLEARIMDYLCGPRKVIKGGLTG